MTRLFSKRSKASRPSQNGKVLLAFLFSCFLATFGLSSIPGFADDSHTPLEPLECPGERLADEAAICFIFHLPADWNNISGRSIEVPIMRFAPTGDLEAARKAAKPPLLMILGGPGQSAIYLEKVLLNRLKPLRKDRELILMDQRGTGPLNSELACSAALKENNRTDMDEMVTCAREVQEAGYQLKDYTTLATARDYRALRYALKIDKWSVIATSYGARVAQKLLELDEKGIDRIVFNSPHFLHTNLMDWNPFPLVEKVMDLCNDDQICRESFPSLYWDFQGLQFDISKVILSEKALSLIKPTKEGQQEVSAEEKTEQAKSLAYHLYKQRLQSLLARHKAGKVPRDIWATSLSMRKALKEQTPWSPPVPLQSNMKKLSLLVHYTIFCQEDGSRLQKKGWETVPQPLYAHFYKAICGKLSAPSLPEGWDKVKKSKKPILILTGNLDTIVNPESPKKALGLYPNATWLRFPISGHDVPAHNLCARQLMMDFLNKKKLDTNCIKGQKLLFQQADNTMATTGN